MLIRRFLRFAWGVVTFVFTLYGDCNKLRYLQHITVTLITIPSTHHSYLGCDTFYTSQLLWLRYLLHIAVWLRYLLHITVTLATIPSTHQQLPWLRYILHIAVTLATIHSTHRSYLGYDTFYTSQLPWLRYLLHISYLGFYTSQLPWLRYLLHISYLGYDTIYTSQLHWLRYLLHITVTLATIPSKHQLHYLLPWLRYLLHIISYIGYDTF